MDLKNMTQLLSTKTHFEYNDTQWLKVKGGKDIPYNY